MSFGIFFGDAALNMHLGGYKPLKAAATKGRSSGCSDVQERSQEQILARESMYLCETTDSVE